MVATQQEARPASPTYRPDIDGLRAVAVLAVVAYHLGIGTGGFVGVDIFFVISGFLITRILADELSAGAFGTGNLLRFYERRIRRIVPALTAMCAATVAVSLFVLFPKDLKELGRSLQSVAIFISNIHFQRKTGYFDGAADEKPLLHTWSLAVEEQYYLAFPLALWLAWRWGGRSAAITGCVVAGIASFAYAEIFVQSNQAQAFFSTPARIWELLAGAVLALGQNRLPKAPAVREALALAGLTLITLTLLTYTPETTFPGLGAVMPVAGSALIIAAGANGPTWVARLLARSVLVGIGLISYSVYLWHWPIMVLAKYRLGPTLEQYAGLSTALLLAASLGAGYLSWRYIEQPFRHPRRAAPRRPAFSAQALVMLASIGTGAALVALHGLPGRWPTETLAMIEPRPTRVLGSAISCRAAGPGQPAHIRICGEPGRSTERADAVMLWGDSHAAMLSNAFASHARNGLLVVTAIQPGCPPLIGVVLGGRARSEKCRAANEATLSFIARERVSKVILVARWPYYAEGSRMRFEQGQPVALGGADGTSQGAVLASLLEGTVRRLLSHTDRVVILAPLPEFDRPVTTSLAKAHAWGHPPPEDPSRDMVARRQRSALAALAQAIEVAPDRVTVADPLPLVCDAMRCAASDRDGSPLYRDTNHLSARGLERMEPFVKALLVKPIEASRAGPASPKPAAR